MFPLHLRTSFLIATSGLSLALVGAVVLLRWLPKQSDSVTIVVLGDIARSPRMCNHTRSLLTKGWTVQLVAYVGEGVVHQRVSQEPA